jgi:hypothetical protein
MHLAVDLVEDKVACRIDVAQDMGMWRTVVSKIMNLRVS